MLYIWCLPVHQTKYDAGSWFLAREDGTLQNGQRLFFDNIKRQSKPSPLLSAAVKHERGGKEMWNRLRMQCDTLMAKGNWPRKVKEDCL